MRKQKKHLLILGILTLVIIAVFFGLQEYNKRKALADLKGNTVRVFNNTEIEQFTYSYADTSYTLEKKEDRWIYTEDSSIELDGTLIAAMLNVAAAVSIEDTIENVEDFEQYGLTEPYLMINCSDGEQEYTIRMGDYNNTIKKYFIRINDEDKVYTTDSSLYYTFTKSIETLKVKPE